MKFIVKIVKIVRLSGNTSSFLATRSDKVRFLDLRTFLTKGTAGVALKKDPTLLPVKSSDVRLLIKAGTALP
jgi:hypothetical protein